MSHIFIKQYGIENDILSCINNDYFNYVPYVKNIWDKLHEQYGENIVKLSLANKKPQRYFSRYKSK
jgi:hypothetical protein